MTTKLTKKVYLDREDSLASIKIIEPKEEIETSIHKQAEKLWYDTWVKQGKKDIGTCTLGTHIITSVGIRIQAPPVQGAMSKFYSSEPVLQFLAEHGISAKYEDGRID